MKDDEYPYLSNPIGYKMNYYFPGLGEFDEKAPYAPMWLFKGRSYTHDVCSIMGDVRQQLDRKGRICCI